VRVRRVAFQGVRRLDGLSRDLPRTGDTDLIVIHGRYGAGKTTFLDALAAAKEYVGPYGSGDVRWDSLVASSGGAVKIVIDWEFLAAERARAALDDNLLTSESIIGRGLSAADPSKVLKGLLTQRPDTERGSIHYFHDSRDLSGPVSYGADEASFSDRLTSRNGKFADLYDVLDQPQRRPAREEGARRLSELFPAIEITGLRRTGISFVPIIQSRESGDERTYQQLSWSEKSAFITALYTAKAPIVDSVFMIDAPELGFGDEGAVDLVQALLRWSKQTQIIVATASKAVRSMREVAHTVELP